MAQVRHCSVAFVVSFALAATAAAETIPTPVYGTDNPWLAGMPAGSVANLIDTAPAESPLLYPFAIHPGDVLRFRAIGGVRYGPRYPYVGPDGLVWTSHDAGAENNIGDLTAPADALVGVFLENGPPTLTPAPPPLDFTPGSGNVAGGTDYLSLAPQLKQPFFIGDGLTSLGVPQQIVVPTGATRLFLGVQDGYDWENNGGFFLVDVETSSVLPAPEPSSLSLAVCGLGAFGLGLVRRLSAARCRRPAGR